MRSPATKRLNHFTFAAILIGAVMLAYVPAIKSGYIWDDNRYVTRNTTLRDTAGLKRIWFDVGATPQYYPLVFSTFWVERRLWGGNPAGYHLTNVFLHAANSVLVWLLLRRLGISGAWVAAILFALHPVQVESVAWITERKNVLSGLFYLLALAAYLRFFRTGATERRPNDWRYYFLSLALFVAALFSKTVTCTLPVTIALILWWKNPRIRWRELAPLAPMVLLGLAAGALTAILERNHVGALGPEWNLSFVERSLIAGRATWFYLWSIVAPWNLMFIYPRWHIDAGVGWQYLFPVAALAVLGALWRARPNLGNGPIVAALFFVVTLAPALGFLNVYPMLFSFVADHFQYLAAIGPLVILATLSVRISRRWSHLVQTCALAVVILGLMASTWRQAEMYKDSETLWSETIRRNPDAWIAHNNLSDPLLARGDFNGAAEHASVALRLRPGYAPAHNNLGLALEGLQRNEEAISEFRRAIELEPDLTEARLNLAGQLVTKNDFGGAEREYTAALSSAPEMAEAHYNYAVLLAMSHRIPEALRECRTACSLDPEDAQCQQLLDVLSKSDQPNGQGGNP